MANYKRRSYAGRKTYYKRARSVRAITTSKAFKASAANMTQNGKFNINVRSVVTITWSGSSTSPVAIATNSVDVPALISSSPMHRQLSNVFDQYKIEKATIKFLPQYGNSPEASVLSFLNFFSVVDRTGFNTVNIDQLRSYGSYKETTFSLTGDTPAPHMVYIGQADVVGKSTYYDTKTTASFPRIMVGGDIGNPIATEKSFTFSIEIDASVRYRGVRLDTSNVSTRLSTY